MAEGPLIEAVRNGDVEVSVPFMRVTGCLQIIPRPHPTHPHSLSLTHIPCTHSKALTLTHTHTNTVAHIYSPHHTFTRTHTPQEVKKLLTAGIKPDAERDEVSVFWCRLD